MNRADDFPLLLFPGALGDFLCFLPAALALAQRHGGVRVLARAEWLGLVAAPAVAGISIEQRAVAELFADGRELSDQARQLLHCTSVVHSWTGHGIASFAPRLRAAAGGAAVHVHPFVGAAGEPAADYYARCAGVMAQPLRSSDLQCSRQAVDEVLRLPRLGKHWLVLHAGSGARRKNWQGFAELAQWWRKAVSSAVIAVAGPAEVERHTDFGFADRVICNSPLPAVHGLLAAAPYFAGNDSGISHLAAAAGARGVVLFGASDPDVWAPRSLRLKVICPGAAACETCGADVFCTHRLAVDRVAAALLG